MNANRTPPTPTPPGRLSEHTRRRIDAGVENLVARHGLTRRDALRAALFCDVLIERHPRRAAYLRALLAHHPRRKG